MTSNYTSYMYQFFQIPPNFMGGGKKNYTRGHNERLIAVNAQVDRYTGQMDGQPFTL